MPDGKPLKIGEAYPKLWRLQVALERDASVGSVMSVTLFLAEAKAEHPLITSLIPMDWVLKALESRFFGRTARYYITEDRTKALFVFRMKETYRQSRVESLETTK